MEFEKLRVEANKLRRMEERIPLKDVYQLHGNGFSRWANYEIKIMREMATFGLESFFYAFRCIFNQFLKINVAPIVRLCVKQNLG